MSGKVIIRPNPGYNTVDVILENEHGTPVDRWEVDEVVDERDSVDAEKEQE